MNTLFGFERVDLKPGASVDLFFALQPQSLKLVNKKVGFHSNVANVVYIVYTLR